MIWPPRIATTARPGHQRADDDRPTADPIRQLAGPGVGERLPEVGDQRQRAVQRGGVAARVDHVDAEERHHQRQPQRVDRARGREPADPRIEIAPGGEAAGHRRIGYHEAAVVSRAARG
jgi:hypothetical protein